MEAFAARYYEANKGLPTGIAANADAACVLSYSTIMLNTDLHSTQARAPPAGSRAHACSARAGEQTPREQMLTYFLLYHL